MDNRILSLIGRFKDKGLSGFEQSEMLELLLSFAVNRKDIDEIAIRLLERFGSMSSVMNASPAALMCVDGISEYSATLLNLIPMVMRQYCRDMCDDGDTVFDTVEKIGNYCVARYFGSTSEVLSVMMLDDDLKLIGVEVLQVGSSSQALVNYEKLAELLFSHNATAFVLIHNHPDGKVVPSEADITVTSWIRENFDMMEKFMLEHIIVSGNRYMPIFEYIKEFDSYKSLHER